MLVFVLYYHKLHLFIHFFLSHHKSNTFSMSRDDGIHVPAFV